MVNAYSAGAILATLQHDLEQYKTIVSTLLELSPEFEDKHITQINEYIEAVQYCRELLTYMISQLPAGTIN